MAEQKAKVVKVGRGGPRGPRPKVQNPGKIFMRILSYVMECYRIQVVAVVICIFVSVFANVQGTLFMQTLIDGYILPLLKEQSSDFPAWPMPSPARQAFTASALLPPLPRPV